jgi:hypothetical protein
MGFLIKLAGKKIEEIKYFLDIAVENIIEGKEMLLKIFTK